MNSPFTTLGAGLLLIVLLMPGSALARKFLSDQQLDGVSRVIVVPMHWRQEYTVTWRGITVFGNRQAVVQSPPQLDIHACVAVGAKGALGQMPDREVEILSAGVVQSYLDQIPRLGSGILSYEKKVMKLIVADYPADLYVTVLTWPGGTHAPINGLGSHGFFGSPGLGADGVVTTFWSASMGIWNGKGKYLGISQGTHSEARVGSAADGEAMARMIEGQLGDHLQTLRGLIVRETEQTLAAIFRGEERPRPGIDDALVRLSNCAQVH